MIEELHEEMAQPYKYEDILRDFGARINTPSQLEFPGIFDKSQKKRYWVDREGKNCFMLYARALTITFSEDSRYWRWYPLKSASGVSVEYAELLDVCSLEVQGAFETGYLTPDTVYEVSYVIRLKDPKYGWDDEVDFSLTLPQSEQKTRKCDLRTLAKGRWSYFRVGEFQLSPGKSGRMDFMLRQIGKWKKGLLILGVDISPRI